MKKSTATTIAAVCVVGALAVGLGAISDWYRNWNVKTWFGHGNSVMSGAALQDDNFTLTPNESDGVVALSVKPRKAANAAGNSYPSYTLTATITTTISNPKLDWTVETGADFSSSATSPVTVTPVSDGATTATVECTAAFTGEVNVKATLRDVGSFATCSVIFEGIPNSLGVSSTDLSQSGGYYKASALGNYTVGIKLDNAFHSVGSKYGNYSMTVEKHGKVKIVQKTYQTMLGWMPTGSVSVNFAELPVTEEFIKFTLSGDMIKVAVDKALASYSRTTTVSSGDTGMGSQTVLEQYNGVESTCYYSVKVVDSVSGLYTTFNVTWGDALASSLSLSEGSIKF